MPITINKRSNLLFHPEINEQKSLLDRQTGSINDWILRQNRNKRTSLIQSLTLQIIRKHWIARNQCVWKTSLMYFCCTLNLPYKEFQADTTKEKEKAFSETKQQVQQLENEWSPKAEAEMLARSTITINQAWQQL